MVRVFPACVFQPKCLLLFIVLVIFLIFAFTNPEQDEVKEEEQDYEITHRVYLDIDIDEQRQGRIVIGLYGEVVPKTKISGLYAQVFSIVGFLLVSHALNPFASTVSDGSDFYSGDVVYGDGRGSDSIYGSVFPDENFKIKHSHAGVVSMVNAGPNSNGSQFFITTIKTSWLDGEHVVFGKVIQGMDTVYAIEGGAGTYSGKPRKKVIIADSGEIPKDKWDEER
uniref:Peptidyl-prolyl cis-trans isomerase n=1 Tax=Salix viminalis TaxID=40686 RepID=A0A6N2L5J6_SALVM